MLTGRGAVLYYTGEGWGVCVIDVGAERCGWRASAVAIRGGVGYKKKPGLGFKVAAFVV